MFVRGMIIPFYGTLESIPSGWTLCNGENGSPDLRGFFVAGAGGEFTLGQQIGHTQHHHTGPLHSHINGLHGHSIPNHFHYMPYHNHSVPGNYTGAPSSTKNIAEGSGAPSNVAVPDHTHQVNPNTTGNTAGNTYEKVNFQTDAGGQTQTSEAGSGNTSNEENIPPAIALYYIMKL